MKEKEVKKIGLKMFQISLMKESACGYDDEQYISTAVLVPPFSIVKSDLTPWGCVDITVHNEIVQRLQFETDDAALTALNRAKGMIAESANWGPWQDGDVPFDVDLYWADRELQEKREELMSQRKQAWEDCSCEKEEGCELCLKNPKFDLGNVMKGE